MESKIFDPILSQAVFEHLNFQGKWVNAWGCTMVAMACWQPQPSFIKLTSIWPADLSELDV